MTLVEAVDDGRQACLGRVGAGAALAGHGVEWLFAQLFGGEGGVERSGLVDAEVGEFDLAAEIQ